MPFGVTPQGFSAETLAQVQADLQAALQAQFGQDIDLSAQGPFGQLIGIFAEREATLWQLGQAVYSAAYPDTASASQLDDLCSITGTVRLPATKSTDSAVLLGTAGTVVPSGTVVATTPSGVQFATTATATIAALAAWAGSTTYGVGALATNDAGKVYSATAITTGISAVSGGPTGTGTVIIDGGVTWRYVGISAAAVAVSTAATLTGPLAAPAGSLTTIVNPVSGLAAVVNPLDAVLGTNQETDAALRLRRLLNLSAQGKSPVAAVAAAISKVSGVFSVQVFENPGDVVDGAGRPPHSLEAVVLGGTDSDVATAIWQSKAAGIQTAGSSTQNVTDPSTAVVYPTKFTRPTSVPIYISVTLTPGTTYAGAAAVKQAIVDYANGLVTALTTQVFGPGQKVYAAPLLAAILDRVGGILDIASVFIGIAPAPTTSTPITIAYNQIAGFDTSRILVNGV